MGTLSVLCTADSLSEHVLCTIAYNVLKTHLVVTCMEWVWNTNSTCSMAVQKKGLIWIRQEH